MNYLAIETSTEAFSVAIGTAQNLKSEFAVAPRKHGELLLPTITKLLDESSLSMSNIDCVVYGKGPGAFTGVRIAVSAAQGLAFGQSCPLIGISSLQNLAAQVFSENDLEYAWVTNDARMNEVYSGLYRKVESDGLIWAELVGQEVVIDPSLLALPEELSHGSWAAVGSGWKVYQESLAAHLVLATATFEDCYPNAATALKLAAHPNATIWQHAVSEAVPSYLRNNVAAKSQKSSIIGADR
ncbi:tRNA (adenosine(37)-N6)-threonylcarbamoyltransferase complex dimerization subunit type 1 TsaB [Pleionea litopenaei]|uniref:tRNA threonylcarbamoyladenosine biosynthesis protein TsaB n=1 Tax=Pleionea litopenaei TaxID=3070815 RepID=A0AA51X7S2_9GAMM|nr:tRNA (adenosine(37)-N6)-threonylcarbamoyltransferase complex dimerization subunit type 1 TsaB [Pleionea sp. HL-JVS1]WMS88166.1 tRNA (adenosine(37)-N6)-threonylcarbamoyltransferase complex dimerization subunit type 1 TsaB [Pleionea sp. HL-JVS1]